MNPSIMDSTSTSVRAIVFRSKAEVLTLYSFSTENWSRPASEVSALMALFEDYMGCERERLIREGIRYRRLGRREGLPASVLDCSDRLEADTDRGEAMTLQIAINYGSRQEITDAARRLEGELCRDILHPDVAAYFDAFAPGVGYVPNERVQRTYPHDAQTRRDGLALAALADRGAAGFGARFSQVRAASNNPLAANNLHFLKYAAEAQAYTGRVYVRPLRAGG